MSKFDPRGLRFNIEKNYARPETFWALCPESKRITNKFLLYRWQRGGPTTFFKQKFSKKNFSCDFRDTIDEHAILGFSVPLASLWLTAFSHADTRTWTQTMSLSSFQLDCIHEYLAIFHSLYHIGQASISKQCSRYGSNVQSWNDILSEHSHADALYVILLHMFQIETDSIINTYLEAMQFCFEHKFCVFVIGTALLQITLMKTIQTDTTRALVQFWKHKLQEVDRTFSNGKDTLYDVKRRGRSCPPELAHDYWNEVIRSAGTRHLETTVRRCLSED